jgi:16S rRNA (guanine527-N7)-methyltransferase
VSLLAETAAEWGIALSPAQLEQFATYAAELQHWNERANLTAITDPTAITTRHFLDSLRCALSWGTQPHTVVDIGAGAGFPGLPLKLAYPALRLTLVESVGKKTAFLDHLVCLLNLEGVTIVRGRAEHVAHEPAHREQYDLVVARAVAALRVLAEYCLPFARVGGGFLAPKGAAVQEEADAAAGALATLGGHLSRVERVVLPGEEPRSLVVVEKRAPTPAAYPRKPGLPARRPL